ncbi:MAG: hypothetical protein V1825_04590, partial [Candidatus Falkowbacteria bacterium]
RIKKLILIPMFSPLVIMLEQKLPINAPAAMPTAILRKIPHFLLLKIIPKMIPTRREQTQAIAEQKLAVRNVLRVINCNESLFFANEISIKHRIKLIAEKNTALKIVLLLFLFSTLTSFFIFTPLNKAINEINGNKLITAGKLETPISDICLMGFIFKRSYYNYFYYSINYRK